MADVEVDWRRGPDLPADRPRILPDLVTRAMSVADGCPVIMAGEDAWTWARLRESAAAIRGRWPMAFVAGQRILITADNDPRHVAVELACWCSGAIAVPVNRRSPPEILRLVVEEVEPALWFTDDPDLPVAGIPAFDLAETDHLPAVAAPPTVFVNPDDPALILYTSGSTGAPRGVTLSHDNLCSQQAAFALLWPEVGPEDRLVSYLPWYHSFGALAERLWALSRGITMHLAPADGHDHEALLATLRQVRPTVFMSVPAIHDLVAGAGVLDPAVLRWVFNAGAVLGHRAEEAYEHAGIRVLEGWGMTETSPSATITPLTAPRIPGVVGPPLPGVAVGIGADGRVRIRGPGVMLGYWRREAETRRVLVDGTLDSGDLGEWTTFGLRLLGRDDHMLKHPNGEKIVAGVLEDRLELLPGVTTAVVMVEDAGLAVILAGVVDVERTRDMLLGFNAAQPHRYLRLQTAYLVADGLVTDGRTGPFKKARSAYLEALARWRGIGGDEVVTLHVVDAL